MIRKINRIIPLLLFLIVWFTFENRFLNILQNKITYSYLCFSEYSFVAISLLFILVLYLIIYYPYKFWTSVKNISKTAALYVLVISLLYFIYRTQSHFKTYISYYTITVIDIFFFIISYYYVTGLVIGFIKKKSSTNNQSLSNSFYVEDSKILHPDETDINETRLKAQLLANNIKEHLRAPNVNAFSIGVIGKWGYGKSCFINELIKNFDKNKYIIIEFNPRNSLNAQHIVQDFFKVFRETINKDTHDFSQILDNYLRSIDVLDENQIRQFISGIYNALFPNDQDVKELLDDIIVKKQYKIIITIDDLDRLLLEELLEVFKIIDGLANFKNSVFITAYDKELVNVIIGEKYSSNDTFYTDKYFNLEIYLAAQPFEEIFNFIKVNLYDKLQTKLREEDFYKELSSLNIYLKQNIHSIREAKRFINLLLHTYNPIRDFVNLKEYALLTLIKMKWYNEYIFIQKHMFRKDFDKFGDNYIELKKDYLKKYDSYNEDDKTIDESFKKLRTINTELYSIFEKLFSNYSFGNGLSYKSIKNKDYFKYYFVEYFDFDKYRETLVYYENKFTKDIDKDILIINEELNNNNIKNLENYFLSVINSDVSLPLLEYYIKIMLHLNRMSNQFNYEVPLFENTLLKCFRIDYSTVEGTISFSNNLYEYCRNEMILNDKFRKKLTLKILRDIENQFLYLLNLEELYKISFDKLKKHILLNSNYSEYISDLLGCCITKIYNKSLILDKFSCSIVKDFLIKNPNNYIKEFIEFVNESSNYVELRIKDIWFNQIFTIEEFTNLIIKPECDNIENIEIIRNFWKIYNYSDTKLITLSNKVNLELELQNKIKRLDNIKIGLEKYVQEPDSMYKESYKIEDLKYINLQNNTAIFENFNSIVELGFAYFEDINELKIKGAGQSYK